MELLCRMFGHRFDHRGWWGDGLYGKVIVGPVDGIRRTHFSVEGECRRCGKSEVMARFHGSERLIKAMLEGTNHKDTPHG